MLRSLSKRLCSKALKFNFSAMLLTILMTFILFQVNSIAAQTSLNAIDLKNGKYSVGFIHYTAFDSARTYNRIYDTGNQMFTRLIFVSIWYPSEQNIGNTKPFNAY